MKKIFYVLIVCLISNFTFTSCNSTKEPTSFEQVKIGNELDKAAKINLDDFFQIWMKNKSNSKLDQNCYELFKDENYTYFGENELKALNIKRKLYKVENSILSQNFKNYKKVDGELIRQEFWNKIIPKSDLETHKKSNCSSSSSNPKYSYELVNNEIEIILMWKFRCNGKKLIDKTYKSNYDLEKMEFKK